MAERPPSPAERLESAVKALLDEARAASLRQDKTERTPKVVATLIADSPSAVAAARLVDESAADNNYLVPAADATGPQKRRPAGRRLDVGTLLDSGIAGALLSSNARTARLAKQLAAYLTGPAKPILRLIATDAYVPDNARFDVAGWRFGRMTAAELTKLSGLGPRLGQRRSELKPELYQDVAWLWKTDDSARPRVRSILPAHLFYDDAPHERAWEPLLILSLWGGASLAVVGEFEVEPATEVTLLDDRIPIDYYGAPDEQIEGVGFGTWHLSPDDRVHFKRFSATLSSKILGLRSNKRDYAQLGRSAKSLLSGERRAYDFIRDEDDINFRYVVALESLLSDRSDHNTELSRRVSQRAGVLAGTTGEECLRAYRIVKKAYSARSRYVHGSDSGSIDTVALREVARRVLVARLLVDAAPEYESVPLLVDDALLSAGLAEQAIFRPVRRFWASGPGSGRTRTARQRRPQADP